MANQADGMIDVHAMLGEENHLRLNVDGLLAAMDGAHIETAIARPMGADLAANWRAGNDRALSAPPRVRAWATANPWAGDQGVDELKRCHQRGAVGLFLHPMRQGFMPIESIVVPLLDFAAGVGWPVMFQTGTYIFGDVLAVGEVARRYPKLPFILGAGGFTDMWFEVPAIMRDVTNLYLDLSILWSAAAVDLIAEGMADRLLFGSSLPRNTPACVLRALARHDVSAADSAAIFGGNARRIFQL